MRSDFVEAIAETPSPPASVREDARLACHASAVTQEDPESDVEMLLDMLGLMITNDDVRNGYGRIPCIVDGVEHTRHRQRQPDGLPPRRKKGKKKIEG